MSTTTNPQPTDIKREIRLGFVYGFFSMAGGLICLSAFANREKIKRVVKYAIQEAR